MLTVCPEGEINNNKIEVQNMRKMKEKTKFDYQTLINKSKPALTNCIKNHVKMTIESTSGFNALKAAVDDSVHL